jgi:hypothetical protein
MFAASTTYQQMAKLAAEITLDILQRAIDREAEQLADQRMLKGIDVAHWVLSDNIEFTSL